MAEKGSDLESHSLNQRASHVWCLFPYVLVIKENKTRVSIYRRAKYNIIKCQSKGRDNGLSEWSERGPPGPSREGA